MITKPIPLTSREYVRPSAQQAMTRIGALLADGSTYQQIADQLNAESLHTSTGKCWSRHNVEHVLRNLRNGLYGPASKYLGAAQRAGIVGGVR